MGMGGDGLWLISIHALREEGDRRDRDPEVVDIVFLSTPSARRATGDSSRKIRAPYISIHALREEGDAVGAYVAFHKGISIHALREEGDGWRAWHRLCQQYFYPRPPRGGRPTPDNSSHFT